MSPLVLNNAAIAKDLSNAEITLQVNSEIKQKSDISHLTWSIEEVICKLSEVFELRPGDLIMTGTPENVGAVKVGDVMDASIEHLGSISLKVTD